MLIRMIQGATRVLGQAQGFIGLPVKDEVIVNRFRDGSTRHFNSMTTAWEPDPNEITRLINGAPLIVRIFGTEHPPILVEVGEIPEDDG